ncbi:MAG: hypothetical protein IJD98_07700 [Oscillospiraceae bacterium]|nr:hypothetical protein [Oscillospiraceae bacterium]
MAEQQTFRTAFNGFNREDVVRYIDYLNTKHASEIAQLNSELEFLRNRPAQTEPAPVAPVAAVDESVIAEQAGRIRELFDQCREQEQMIAAVEREKAELADRLAAAQEELVQLRDQMDTAAQQQVSFKSRMEEELEAYRRAERTERLARERAERMYQQANGVLADATVKVDDAATQIGALSDRVISQLTELQNAVSGSKQALRDAAATMYTIRTGTDIK